MSIKSFSTVKAFMTGFVAKLTFWDIPIAIVSTSSLVSAFSVIPFPILGLLRKIGRGWKFFGRFVFNLL